MSRTGAARMPIRPLLLLIATACAPGAPERQAAEDGRTLPETRIDTVLLEGMPEEIRLSLFETPDDFPLPFHAYVPEGIAPEVLESDSGGAVRFVSEMGGVRNEGALLHLHVYAAGTSEEAAAAAVRGFASSRGALASQGEGEEPTVTRRFEWSVAEYSFRERSLDRGPISGVVALGRRPAHVFHVLLQYPPEYEEGFVPRARKILETLRWEDTGEGLRVPGGSR